VIEDPKQVYEFDEFRLDVMKRQLTRQGEVVPLYSKAFDLLLAMVQNGGRDLTKDELLETVWPGQMLEEANLTVNMSAVRKALGEKAAQPRYIITIPGRGYRFVAALNRAEGLVIQSQTISQITVEEETDDSAEAIEVAPHSFPTTQPEASPPDQPSRTVAAAPQPKQLAAGPSQSFLKNRAAVPMLIVLALFVGIVAVVALTIGGRFWPHKSSAKNSAFLFQRISIKRLTTRGIVSRAALSPDGKLFVYSLPDGDLESLWLGHVDGGEPIQIRPPADNSYLTMKFMPNGSGIYYTVRDNSSNGTLYKIPVFGGAPEKIRDNLNSLTFSPDARQFAFLRYDTKQRKSILVTADADGGNERGIATMPSEISSGWHSPAWSPDGLTIAVAASVKPDAVNLFVVNLADGSTKLLTPQTWRVLEGITWLKDGTGLVSVGLEKNSLHSQLCFISFPGGEVQRPITDLNDYGFVTSLADDGSLLALQGISQSNIWVAPAGNLKDAKQITFDSAGRNDGWHGLAWTHDGRIVYAADDGEGRTLWIINAAGGKPKQLIPNGGLNSYPSITADGRYLVFESNRSGHFAVWRSDFDGGNMSQLTGEQMAGQPSVSPDGKWILYNSNVESVGELFRIPIEGGEPFRMINKPAGWAFVSPDSKLVACQLDTNGKPKLAILSLESGELLKLFDVPRLANLRLGVHWTPDSKAVSYRDWVNGIWKQNLDGGQPQRLEGLPEERLFSYSWSPDGKLFAFARGTTTRDVVLIKGEE
jgi:Tol biopolymer transport system component/DNA-binding winged helix-turn-helix (wHTH) protein